MIYRPRNKIPKYISSPFEAKSKTTFDYCSPEIDRKRAEDMSDYISAPGNFSKKLFQAIEANSKTTFDYCSPEIVRKQVEDISDYI